MAHSLLRKVSTSLEKAGYYARIVYTGSIRIISIVTRYISALILRATPNPESRTRSIGHEGGMSIKELPIYNLYIGEDDPGTPFQACRVGPFEIELVDNYHEVAKGVPLPSRRSAVMEGSKDAIVRKVSQIPARQGRWTRTATARLVETSAKSILALTPIDDDGMWDLGEILTFLNGRRVVVGEEHSRYKPDAFGDPTCIDAEILVAAAKAWSNRQVLVNRKLTYAFLMQNLAIEYSDLGVLAYFYSAAFNAIYDDWSRRNKSSLGDLTDSVKDSLKRAISNTINAQTILTELEKTAVNNLIASKIQQGLKSPVEITTKMLVDLGVIPDPPPKSVIDRVKFLNQTRNNFIHTGRTAIFKLNPGLSVGYAAFIIRGVLCGLVQRALGEALGFTSGGVGSLCMHTDILQTFFTKGIWNGIPIETTTYEDWVRTLDVET